MDRDAGYTPRPWFTEMTACLRELESSCHDRSQPVMTTACHSALVMTEKKVMSSRALQRVFYIVCIVCFFITTDKGGVAKTNLDMEDKEK